MIVVNDNYRLCPWADVLYACDAPWWSRHIDAVRRTFAGELWTQDTHAAAKYGIEHIQAQSRDGLCLEPGMIFHGGNSGYQAIGLAYTWGAARVILLGFDCQFSGGKRHWFGDHPRGLNNATGLEGWKRTFPKLAADAKKAGLEIVNATRETALDCFPRMRLADALHHSR